MGPARSAPERLALEGRQDPSPAPLDGRGPLPESGTGTQQGPDRLAGVLANIALSALDRPIRPASTSKAIATIDLRGAVTRTRLIVFQRSCNSSHAHTVKIVVPGTAGRLRVDLDAIAVMK